MVLYFFVFFFPKKTQAKYFPFLWIFPSKIPPLCQKRRDGHGKTYPKFDANLLFFLDAAPACDQQGQRSGMLAFYGGDRERLKDKGRSQVCCRFTHWPSKPHRQDGHILQATNGPQNSGSDMIATHPFRHPPFIHFYFHNNMIPPPFNIVNEKEWNPKKVHKSVFPLVLGKQIPFTSLSSRATSIFISTLSSTPQGFSLKATTPKQRRGDSV